MITKIVVKAYDLKWSKKDRQEFKKELPKIFRAVIDLNTIEYVIHNKENVDATIREEIEDQLANKYDYYPLSKYEWIFA